LSIVYFYVVGSCGAAIMPYFSLTTGSCVAATRSSITLTIGSCVEATRLYIFYSYRAVIGQLVILLMHGYWSGVEQECEGMLWDVKVMVFPHQKKN
jgi:hypothetical protein